MRLWSVATGKCLFFWEFPTAVKRVAFSEDDDQVVCITEQRMGHQGAVRIFNINRDGDGTQRKSVPAHPLFPHARSCKAADAPALSCGRASFGRCRC